MWEFCSAPGSNPYFDAGQYLLGDSGYMALPHLVCAFKRTDYVSDKEDFNTCIAKCRVTNEHCIGVLKSCWHSLKEIRVQLNGKKDNKHANRWILLCAKLHNFVIACNDHWTPEDDNVSDEAEAALHPPVSGLDTSQCEPPRPTRRGVAEASNALLRAVMREALAVHRQPGGFLNPT